MLVAFINKVKFFHVLSSSTLKFTLGTVYTYYGGDFMVKDLVSNILELGAGCFAKSIHILPCSKIQLQQVTELRC